jgi:hypothetical protein
VVLLVVISLVTKLLAERTKDNHSQVATSVNQTEAKVQGQSIIDIPQLAGKTSNQVEQIIGKATTVTTITNDPERMPGEYRDYKIEGALLNLTIEGLMIRYYKGIAVHFSLDLPRASRTPEEALLMAGIDVRGVSPQTSAPLAERWNGRFSDVDFMDAAAMRRDLGTKTFSTVQATILK